MFKGFSDSSRNQEFHGFPNLNFQMNNEAYGFSGCSFWLDAAYGLNTQTNLGAVSSWKDRIRSIDFKQATAGNQPRLVTSLASFNNLPAIDAGQTNTRTLTADVTLALGSSFTLCIVHQEVQQSSIRNVVLGVTGNNNFHFCSRVATSNAGFYSTNTPLLQSTVRDFNPHIYIITNNRIIIDGVDDVQGTLSPTASFDTIGSSGGGTCHKGYVGEIFILDQELTSVQCVELSSRLNSKYAIY
jgi:hypothetical protein